MALAQKHSEVLCGLCGGLKDYRCNHKWPDQKIGWEKHLVHSFERTKCFSAAMEVKTRIRWIPEHQHPKRKCLKKSKFHWTSVEWDREMSNRRWGLGSSLGQKPKIHRMKVRALIFQQGKPAFWHLSVILSLSLYPKRVKGVSQKKQNKNYPRFSISHKHKKFQIVRFSKKVVWGYFPQFYLIIFFIFVYFIILYYFTGSKSE